MGWAFVLSEIRADVSAVDEGELIIRIDLCTRQKNHRDPLWRVRPK